jgi:hypothetical protein
MSNNIAYSRYIMGSLSIQRSAAWNIKHNNTWRMPENHLLSKIGEVIVEINKGVTTDNGLDWCPLSEFRWNGERSWAGYQDVLLPLILPRTMGTAQIIFTREDGSSFGLLVQDGKVEEMDVVISLKKIRKLTKESK